MEAPVTVTVPAFAADTMGETLSVRVPADWAPRVEALAPFCQYGPMFSRGVVSNLRDVDRLVGQAYSAGAYDYLLAAERIAAR